MSDDPYKYFRVELAELLQKLHEGLLAFESGEFSERQISEMLRYAHTLKGAARVVRQVEIANAVHQLEERLLPYRGATRGPATDVVAALLADLSSVRELGKALSSNDEARLGEPNAEATAVETRTLEAKTVRTDLQEVDAVLEGASEALVEVGSLQTRVSELSEIRERATRIARRLTTFELADDVHARSAMTALVADVELISRDLHECERGAAACIERVERELASVRGTIERLKLIPTSTIFTALDLAVRDATRAASKAARLVCSGGDVRVEGSVLELVQQAFLHVVRNSVTHGVESPDVRQRRNKPAQGTIEFTVREEQRRVTFECKDDGAGFDVERARRIASARHGASALHVSESALFELALQGGLSTAPEVTELSGRGVGLNVLAQTAKQLGGEVGFENERGHGLVVRLEVPVSLGALEVIGAEFSGVRVLLPLPRVVRALTFDAKQLVRGNSGDALNVDGNLLPFANLDRVVGIESDGNHVPKSVAVVRGQASSVALGVERLLERRTVILREIPKVALPSDVVAGAALDTHGNPELILDADGLVAHVRRLGGAVRLPDTDEAGAILVVDDSLTTRMLEQSILESAGYEVELATSGEDGLRIARSTSFGLLLVDVEMPGMDGFEFIRQARADPDLAHVPAVLVTSRNDPDDFEKGRRAGAEGYIVKGQFDQRELLTLIDRLMKR